jgi:hypothetical protein
VLGGFAALRRAGCLHPGAPVVFLWSPSETMSRLRPELHGSVMCRVGSLSRVPGPSGSPVSRGMTARGSDALSIGALGVNDPFYERFLRLVDGKDQPQPEIGDAPRDEVLQCLVSFAVPYV